MQRFMSRICGLKYRRSRTEAIINYMPKNHKIGVRVQIHMIKTARDIHEYKNI